MKLQRQLITYSASLMVAKALWLESNLRESVGEGIKDEALQDTWQNGWETGNTGQPVIVSISHVRMLCR